MSLNVLVAKVALLRDLEQAIRVAMWEAICAEFESDRDEVVTPALESMRDQYANLR